MLRYQSRRHRILMDESEQAIADAVHSAHLRHARIARHLLSDNKAYGVWESRHADLIVPVAEEKRRSTQIFGLRNLEIKLLHRRALIRTIRQEGIVGQERDRLFGAFYGPRDTQDAILAEHRQYTLAVSSRVSADHLIDIMDDPASITLLREYEKLYSKYFGIYCDMVSTQEQAVADALKPELSRLRRRLLTMIRRIHSERPLGSRVSFESRALLARSGRHKVRDYLYR
jgi:hypothetical protein